jgi:hypothetical protein
MSSMSDEYRNEGVLLKAWGILMDSENLKVLEN